MISHDCPHAECRTRNAAFELVGEVVDPQNPNRCDALGKCLVCKRGVMFTFMVLVSTRGWTKLADLSRDLRHIIAVSPEPPKRTVSENIPEDVRVLLAEVYEALDGETNYRLPAMGLRAAMETAVKILDPNGKGNLQARIEALRSAITPDAMIDMLHQVRFLGNDGAHDAAVDRDEVLQGAEFVRLFMHYAFDMPAQVEAAKARRESR